MLKSSFAAIYGCLIGLVGLTLLMTSAIVAPGCTGVPSAHPCDYVALAKQGASQFGGHSKRDGFEVLDRGSSVYVHQPLPAGWTDGPPGVLIDKKSCRICEVRAYGSLPRSIDTFDPPKGRVLASVPPEQPRQR